MIRTVSHPGAGQVEVTFTLPHDAVHGDPPSVVGDFNGWDPDADPFTLSADGSEWQATLMLPPGRRYAFRYRTADGHWFNDEAATSYEDNGIGDTNAVLDVSPLAPLESVPQNTPPQNTSPPQTAPSPTQTWPGGFDGAETAHAQRPPHDPPDRLDPAAQSTPVPAGLHPVENADRLDPDALSPDHAVEDSSADASSAQTREADATSQG